MRQKYEIFSYQQLYLQNYLRVIFYTLIILGDKIGLLRCFGYAQQLRQPKPTLNGFRTAESTEFGHKTLLFSMSEKYFFGFIFFLSNFARFLWKGFPPNIIL